MNKEYFDCVHNLWTGFVGKATCEAGYLKCDGLSCPMYTQKKGLKSMTHFDGIKAMSVEELAKYINEISNGDCPTVGDCPEGVRENETCTPWQCWLYWLKSPVEPVEEEE